MSLYTAPLEAVADALGQRAPISAACFGMGAFFALFGGIAIFKD